MYNLVVFPTLEELSVSLARELHTVITRLLKEKSRINIALSGSSTPQVLFKELAEQYSTKIKWQMINIFWVDERCVPPDHVESNYGTAKKSMLDQLPIPEENIKRIKGEEDPEVETGRYSELVAAYVEKKNNIPSFNIVLLGIGEDGHTASIFPDQMYLLNSSQIYAHSKNPSNRQSRITMTGNIINNSQYIYFLVSGDNKAAIVKRIIKREPEASAYPASYINPPNENLYWYLDSRAAALL